MEIYNTDLWYWQPQHGARVALPSMTTIAKEDPYHYVCR